MEKLDPETKVKMKGWLTIILVVFVITAVIGGAYYVMLQTGTISSESEAKQALSGTTDSLSDISNTLDGIQQELG